ncbi:MAG: alpha/beta fold hydrolase [Deltaproteobacteria bacterium]
MPNSLLRSRYVMAGGIPTHYVETGHNGPPIVLCHGGAPGFSGEVAFGKIMPALGAKFRVYALDSVGGYGYTDPYFPAAEGAQSRVNHLDAFLTTLCLDTVCLGGNSQGAWVAVRYALQHPERVRKLFLIASGTIASAMGLEHTDTDGLRALHAYDGTRESMRALLQTLLWDKSQITDALVDRHQASATRPGAAEARRVFLEGMQRLTQSPNLRIHFQMIDTLPRMNTPAVFIWGEDDCFAPLTLGKQLEKALPNIPFTYIPHAGHLVQNDQPEVITRMMIEFFSV